MNQYFLQKDLEELLLTTLPLIGIKYITTEKQKKNGTIVMELPIKTKYGYVPTFALYKSGYVRVLKSKKSLHPYQLNKKYKCEEKYMNNDFKLVPYTTVKRALIHNRLTALVYLTDYIMKNYKEYLLYTNYESN